QAKRMADLMHRVARGAGIGEIDGLPASNHSDEGAAPGRPDELDVISAWLRNLLKADVCCCLPGSDSRMHPVRGGKVRMDPVADNAAWPARACIATAK